MNRRDAIKALMVGIPAAATISEVKLEPSDVLVVEVPGILSSAAIQHIKMTMEQVWPGRKCAVLSDGAKLKVAKG